MNNPDNHEQTLEQELRMLQSWADGIGVEARTMIPQILEAIRSKTMPLPSLPCRGSLGVLCLSGLSQRADEIKGSLGRVANLLLSDKVEWNNRGDEKG